LPVLFVRLFCHPACPIGKSPPSIEEA
jgi:hypothetical protein